MTDDLFTFYGEKELHRNAPLAERLRPRTLDEFVGQGAILADGRLLRRAISADRIGSMLFYGPPGVGKTTLARIIAANTRSHFSVLNAVLVGVKELREEVGAARKRLGDFGLRTILFIDEVHRFNSAQQDALLPWMENGVVTLIGATTENPYFEVNKALVSRTRIFRLESLTKEDLSNLLERALKDKDRGYGNISVEITDEAVEHLVDVANGDARSLLNALELAVETSFSDQKGLVRIDLPVAEDSIQQRAVLYDKQGDAHFDTISAFIKSLRGSDPDAALFWLARMLEAGENPRFIFRRMLIAAGEDIGLADPQAIVVVEACAAAFERVGLPEGYYSLSQAALYLALSEKSNSLNAFFEAQRMVRSLQRQEVPNHLKDAHRDGPALGDGVGYRYPHSFPQHWVAQQYLPAELHGTVFWKPTDQGWEGRNRLKMLERRAAQFAAAIDSTDQYPLLTSLETHSPDFEKWFQEHINNEADRLQNLLAKLWSGIQWKRNDRVLVIGSRSIFWALSPLREVIDGGVTLFISTKEAKERITAEMESLDLILRPELLGYDFKAINALPKDLCFEWIGGRINAQDLEKNDWVHFWRAIKSRASENAGLRLLISSSTIGPAGSIRKLLNDNELTMEVNALFGKLIELEEEWLSYDSKEDFLHQQLSILGWDISIEQWEESLRLKIDHALIQRWFSVESTYYQFIAKHDSLESVKTMRAFFERYIGQYILQNLTHRKYLSINFKA